MQGKVKQVKEVCKANHDLECIKCTHGPCDNRKKQYTKVIAVDFDGTLCKGGCYPEVGEPNMHVIEYVNYLHQVKGYEVILWTCRAGEPLEKAIYWCAEHNLHIDSVNAPAPSQNFHGPSSCKVYADIYLDDRAKHINDIDGTYMPVTTTKIPMPPVKEPKKSMGSLTVDVGIDGMDEAVKQLQTLKGLYTDIDTLQQRIIRGAERVEKIACRCARVAEQQDSGRPEQSYMEYMVSKKI